MSPTRDNRGKPKQMSNSFFVATSNTTGKRNKVDLHQEQYLPFLPTYNESIFKEALASSRDDFSVKLPNFQHSQDLAFNKRELFDTSVVGFFNYELARSMALLHSTNIRPVSETREIAALLQAPVIGIGSCWEYLFQAIAEF